MQDREEQLRRGMVCGALAAFAVLANDVLWYNLLHLSGSSLSVGLSVVVLGHQMHNLPESLVGWLGHLPIGAILGAVYVLLADRRPDPENPVLPLSATALSISGWLASVALGTFFRVPVLYIVPWTAAIFWFVGAIGWGVSFAWLYRRAEMHAALEHARSARREELRVLVSQLSEELGNLDSPACEQPRRGKRRIRYVRRK